MADSRKRKPAAAAAAGPSGEQQCWLIKSEPHVFSIDDLNKKPNQTEGWDGVRNYVARNNLKAMRLGDLALFYHSNTKTPGIVGVCEVVREAYPDPTALDPTSDAHDPKASDEDPRWFCVDFKLIRQLSRLISLEELKTHKEGALADMALFRQSRLSVQPVTRQQWDFVLGMEGQEAPAAAPPAAKKKKASEPAAAAAAEEDAPAAAKKKRKAAKK